MFGRQFTWRRALAVIVSVVVLTITAACGGVTQGVVSEAVEVAREAAATAIAPTAAPAEPTVAPATEQPAATEAPAPTEAPSATEMPGEAPVNAQPAVLGDQGFGQDGTVAGYAFVVSNPNESAGLEGVEYQVAATDAAGTVVATDSGFLTVLFPGETQGVAGTVYVDEGVTIAAVTVQIAGGEVVNVSPDARFTADRVTYIPDDINNRATGVIGNPLGSSFNDVRVSAVAYDATGAIIGGGYSFVNFVPAGGTTGVSAQVTVAGEVASVVMYPTLSSLSLLQTDAMPDDGQSLELLNQGFGADEFSTGYGILVRNPNATYALQDSRYRVTAFDEAGNVLATDEGYVELIQPGQTLAVGGSLFAPDETAIASIEAMVQSGAFEPSSATEIFTSENVAFLPGDFLSDVTGLIVNPYDVQVSNVRVTALAYDAADQIIGGGYTFLDFVPAQGSAGVSVQVSVNGEPARVELYAALSALSEMGE